MARQTALTAPKQMAVGRQGAKSYPSVSVERLPPPPDLPALRMRGVQIGLWRRLRRSLRWIGIATAALASLGILSAVFDTETGFAPAAFGFFLLVWLFAMPVGLIGAFRVVRIAWRLRRTGWKAYEVVDFQIPLEQAITMTLVDGSKRYPIRITNSRRSESLRGMIRPQVWFIGNPARRGILTPAGGGEMLWTHPNPVALTAIRKPITPNRRAKPRPVKPVDPEKARKRAAKVKERTEKERLRVAKVAARYQARIDKHPPRPAKPRPVREPKPPKLPRIRGGQKIKWQ